MIPTRLNRNEVIKAIKGLEPSRIPCWYDWIADETREKYGGALQELLSKYQNDILIVDYDMPTGFKEPAPGRDEWSIYYIKDPGLFSGMRTSDFRGRDWNFLENNLMNKFPDPYAKGRFKSAIELRKNNRDAYIVGHWWATFFERFTALRKEDDFLTDIYVYRDKVDKLGWMICDFFCGIVDGFAEAGMDGIFFSDDLGFNNQLIVPPEIFRDIFKPWFKKLFERIHKHNMHIIMHSCGYLWDIIPDLIEIGLDVHHFQSSVISPEEYVKEYGDYLTFFGGIDIQRFLPNTDPAGVKKGVKQYMKILDHNGGRYMAGPTNTIMPDTSLENIKAMYESMNYYADRNILYDR